MVSLSTTHKGTLPLLRFEEKILKIKTTDGREELDVVAASEIEEDDVDVDDIVADDGTFKRPPLRRGALVPDEQTKRAIRLTSTSSIFLNLF